MQQPNQVTPEEKAQRDKQKSKNYRELLVRNVSVRQFNKMVFSTMVLSLIVLLSVIFVAADVKNRVAPPLHVAADREFRYDEPVSKRIHNHSDSEISTYTANVVTKMFSYDWYNAPSQLNNQVEYFTNEGWMGFKENLELSGTLNFVRDNHYISSLQIIEAPQVLNKGVETLKNGDTVAFWTVQAKVNLLYISSETGNAARQDNAEITARIVRVSTLEREDGVAINQIILKITKNN